MRFFPNRLYQLFATQQHEMNNITCLSFQRDDIEGEDHDEVNEVEQEDNVFDILANL